MAAGEATPGRRVRDKHAWEFEPCDYGNRESNWYGVTPNGLLCTLTKHTVTEHEDGTITVSPSILCKRNGAEPLTWHGCLERGVWREV